MAEYKITLNGVLHRPTNRQIPKDPENADYQAFLTWQAAGNTPDPLFSLSELKAIRRQEVRREALRRIVDEFPAVDSIEFVDLLQQMFASISPAVVTLTPRLVRIRDIRDAAVAAIAVINALTDPVAVAAYDPVNDPAWPA